MLRDPVTFSLPLLHHLSPSGSQGKELRGPGPNGKEGASEEGHCPMDRRMLQARVWQSARSWEVSQCLIFCFFLLGLPVSEVAGEGSWGLPGLYK